MTVHLFNIGGYRLLFHFFVEKADERMTERLDQHAYNESDLIAVKVPIRSPYSSGSRQKFERFEGSFELDGKHYNYVKRKICNDTLILLCIPNDPKKKLKDAKEVFAKMTGDASSSDTEKHHSTFPEKSLLKEYPCYNQEYNCSAPSFRLPVLLPVNEHTIYGAFTLIPELPPKQCDLFA